MPRREIVYKKLRWIDIGKFTQKDLNWLSENFHVHPLTLDDIRHGVARSKVDAYDATYYFIALLLPEYQKAAQNVSPSKVYFFVYADTLITLHHTPVPALEKFFDALKKDAALKRKLLHNGHISSLLYEVLSVLLRETTPLLDHLNERIERVETKIFKTFKPSILQDILPLRRNIIDLRKISQPHQILLQHLLSHDEHLNILKLSIHRAYFHDLMDTARETWDSLEEYKESIETLHETHQSLISHRINLVMKKLTLISVVILPMGLIAGIFGMNAQNIPFVNHPLDFFFMLLLLGTAGFVMIAWLILKGWFE